MKAYPWTQIGAAVLVALSLVLVAAGDPSLDERIEQAEPELHALLTARDHHVDPWEVYEAIHNNQMRLILVDVRSDRDFNLFHLRHAKHIKPEALTGDFPLLATAVVLMSNDEALAEQAFKRLWVQGQKNTYIMAGGVNLWLQIFSTHPYTVDAKPVAKPDGTLRHEFTTAKGADYPFAHPPPAVHAFKHETHKAHHHTREFKAKIKLLGPKKKKTGGCG